MSCGLPHDIDCTEVLHDVHRFLDGEMDDERLVRIRQHLDECSPCLRQFGIEKEIKQLVARCCSAERAPDDLRVRIITRIKEVRIEFGSVEFRSD
jgi:mycothiol system anti-sigma-R factor